MFVGDEMQVQVSAVVAAARLASLIGGSSLSRASRAAWDEGIARVGPVGPAPGLSKLVRVQVLPVERGAVTVLALRWEATGTGGRLFPILDANISLLPDGEQITLLGLEGVYRPPGGAAGAWLDRTILHRVATATIRSFLYRIADAITDPVPARSGDPDSAEMVIAPSWIHAGTPDTLMSRSLSPGPGSKMGAAIGPQVRSGAVIVTAPMSSDVRKPPGPAASWD
jgi:hypothetical protein